MLFGLGKTPRLQKRIPQVGARLGAVRSDPDGMTESVFGFPPAPCGQQQQAQVVMRFDIIRIHIECCRKRFRRLRETSFLSPEQAQAMICLHVILAAAWRFSRPMPNGNMFQRPGQPGKHPPPIIDCTLPHQSRRGIPRAVRSPRQPAPAGIKTQQHPHRLAHRTRKMRDRRIDGNDQIKVVDQCGRIGKIGKLLRQIDDSGAFPARVLQITQLPGARRILLQTVERHAGQSSKRFQLSQRHIATGIVFTKIGMACMNAGLPGQADTQAIRFPKTRLPGSPLAWIGRQVGQTCGNALQRRPEFQRQAHQGTVKIDRRQCFPFGKDLDPAIQTAQQLHQRRLHLQEDFGATRCNEGSIAAELQSVAQALLRMQQYPPAFQFLIAMPARCRILPDGPCSVRHPSRPANFVGRPARCVVALHQQPVRHVPARVHEIGPKL
nr:hypothetical protein [Sterolibacterium denitrificans]